MKLSFSFQSKSSSKKRPIASENNQFNEGDTRNNGQTNEPEFVTEFDPSKILKDGQGKHIVIPPRENTWTALKKMKNIDIPLRRSATDSTDLAFEPEVPTSTEDDPNVSYGLNLRGRENGGDGMKVDEDVPDQLVVPGSMENSMLQKFKEDMQNLPEDRGFDEFIDVPVEGFGAALLAGYGWKEGQGIGKNAKEDVKVIQYVRRGGREGLGFEPEVNDTKKQKGRNSGPQLVAPKGPDGRTRHVVGIDEKLVPRELKGIHVGKIVRVVDGRHVGLKGKVLDKLGGDDSGSSTKVVLELVRSGEQVTVRLDEVAESGSWEEEKCMRNLEELKIRASKDDRRHDDRRDSKDGRRHDDRRDSKDGRRRDDKRDASSREDREKKDGVSNQKKREREGRRGDEVKSDNGVSYTASGKDSSHREEERKAPVSWLTSHIRVRVISKDLKGGKLYLKKGVILDVVGPAVCDISMDESKEIIQGVDQRILETALPRRGGTVLILYGKHKGVYGNLVERDMEKETGVVQDAGTSELLNVRLEQIAEYTGDPSYLGY